MESYLACVVTRSWTVTLLAFGLCVAHVFAQDPGFSTTETPVELAVYIENVHDHKDYRVVQFDKQEVIKIGSSFDMSCHLQPGKDPNAKVKWYKDGRQFSETARALLKGWRSENRYQDYEIRFLNFSVDDAGSYKCETARGHVFANLTVSPVIANFTREVTAFVGQSTILHCDAKGYPKPTVQWLDQDNADRTGVNNELRLSNVSQRDNGTYKCRANNSAGTDVETVSLFILVPLRFKTALPNMVRASLGDTVILNCDASGGPAPSYKWFVQGQRPQQQRIPLVGGVAPTHALRNVQADIEQRSYTCEVNSYFPNSRRSAQHPLEHTFHIRLGGSNESGKNGKNRSSGMALIALPSLVLVSFFLPLFATQHF